MGLEIDKEDFSPNDYVRFSERLHESLGALAEILAWPGFGLGARTVGLELEMFLVDAAGHPLPRNLDVIANSDDSRLCSEIARYNLELNLNPEPLSGRPFSSLSAEVRKALARTRTTAAKVGGKIATIGSLPTLRESHLAAKMLTDKPRYRALSRGAQRLRQSPFRIRIRGEDAVDFECDDVSAEGANTSMQVHLRISPEEFPAFYNAAQIATGPALAAAGNSPLFLGKQLWDETRIALFRDAIDDRSVDEETEWRPARVSFGHGWIREGAWEVFAESVAMYASILPVTGDENISECVRTGRVPELRELKLHHGTVWRWNRAVYDHNDGGHIRIEYRAFPSGPTADDMMANAAFVIGLTLALAPRLREFLPGLTFGQARLNFYRAAQVGLDAKLLWPSIGSPSPEELTASELILRLVPLAHAGLVENGVATQEAERFLGIITRRVQTGRTGARWQRERFAKYEKVLGREKALEKMFLDYSEQSAVETPVHEWDWE